MMSIANVNAAMHQTRPGFIPMDEPAPPPIKLRPFVPDDNEDVFYYRHAQGICPPDSTVCFTIPSPFQWEGALIAP